MRHNYNFCILILLTALVMAGCKQPAGLPSLKETYSKNDKNPFGSFIFFDQLQLIFNQNSLNIKKVSFDKFWHETEDCNALFISVSKNLYLSRADVKSILEFADAGNTIFISSQQIDSALLNSLGCRVAPVSPLTETLRNINYTSVSMDTGLIKNAVGYRYYYMPFTGNFSSIDTSITRGLGINNFGNNYIEIYYGKGRVLLHCEPRALSNYFLLQDSNYQYLQNIFAFTNKKPDHVYWDDFYNKRNHAPTGNEGKGGLSMLLQYPSMAWAFYLVIIVLVLYILIGGKRRQRIVPAIPPNNNTTILFTETINNLYLQKKDNKNIADKMILYFYDHLRKQYYINTSQVNDDFINSLSKKCNVSIEETQSLFKLIVVIQQAVQISDEQLLSLNNKIDNFYLNKI